MFPHQSASIPLTQQQPSSVDFASAPIDPALMAAQMHAARAQNEMDALAKKVRADRIALEQPWKDPRFFPITTENVMFYFCQRENPFFDPSSDNALILMQNQGIGPAQLDTVLKAMTGTQFVLVEPCAPPLFLVRKQQRNGPDKITPLCHFYVLDGTVYQAPDMHTLLHSRLIGVMDPLRCAFQETVSMLRFTPARGHFWEFRTRPARRASSTAATDETEPNADELTAFDEKLDTELNEAGHRRTTTARGGDPLATRATPYQNQRTHALLAALAERFKDSDGSEGGIAGQNAIDRRGGITKTMQQKTDSPQPMSVDDSPQASSVAFSASLISDFQGLLFSSAFPKQQQQQQHHSLGGIGAANGEGQQSSEAAGGE